MIEFPLFENENMAIIEQGVSRANRLFWNIEVVPPDHEVVLWRVFAGDKAVLITDSQETVEAFLYGMGLPLYFLFEDVFERLVVDNAQALGLEQDLVYDPPQPFTYPFEPLAQSGDNDV